MLIFIFKVMVCMTMAHSPLRTKVLVEQYVKKCRAPPPPSPVSPRNRNFEIFFFICLSGCELKVEMGRGCQASPLIIWNLMKYIWRGIHVESNKWSVNTLPPPWNMVADLCQSTICRLFVLSRRKDDKTIIIVFSPRKDNKAKSRQEDKMNAKRRQTQPAN